MNEAEQTTPPTNDPGSPAPRGAASESTVWLRLLVLLNVGVLASVVVFLVRGGVWSPKVASGTPNSEQLKTTATSLEDRGLDGEAAAAWQRYLDATPDEPERAAVLAHIGWLQMQDEQFEAAAGSFVRSELAAGDDKDMKEKAQAGLLQAYRAMGRFGEIGRELSRQAESGTPKKDTSSVVARIGKEVITEADLNRMIQHRADQILASQDESGDQGRRQALLRQLSSTNVRAQLLRDLMQTELFVRRARELKLDKQMDFLLAREQAVDSLLVRRLLQHELNVTPPSEAELKKFYEAHLAEFHRPESMSVLGIGTADEKTAAALMEKIKSADDFRRLAENPGPRAKGFAQTIFRDQNSRLLGNVNSLFALKEDQWTREPIANGSQRFLILAGKKAPARTPSFEEVRSGIQSEIMRKKQKEAVDKLFTDLEGRYQAELLLKAAPTHIEGVPSEAGKMLGETGPAPAQPALPAIKPPVPATQPSGKPAPKKTPAEKPPLGPGSKKPAVKTP